MLQEKRLPPQPDRVVLYQTSASSIRFCKHLTIQNYRILPYLHGNSKLNGATNKEFYWSFKNPKSLPLQVIMCQKRREIKRQSFLSTSAKIKVAAIVPHTESRREIVRSKRHPAFHSHIYYLCTCWKSTWHSCCANSLLLLGSSYYWGKLKDNLLFWWTTGLCLSSATSQQQLEEEACLIMHLPLPKWVLFCRIQSYSSLLSFLKNRSMAPHVTLSGKTEFWFCIYESFQPKEKNYYHHHH